MHSTPNDRKQVKIIWLGLLQYVVIIGFVMMTSCTTSEVVAPTGTPVHVLPAQGQIMEAFTDNIAYTGEMDVLRLLSVRLPENTSPPYPTVVMFHSGVFVQGDKADMDEVAIALSQREIAVVNVNYRFEGYPAPVEDAFCALAWVHHEAQNYGFDTDRIFTLGGDVGGTLAAMLGLVIDPSPFLKNCPNTTLPSQSVAGVVSYGATYNFAAVEDFLIGRRIEKYNTYLGRTQDGYEQRVLQASPVSYIHTAAPPFLLFHGLNDAVVRSEHTGKFASALQAAGVSVEFTELLGVDQFLFELKLVTLEDMQLDKVEAFIREL